MTATLSETAQFQPATRLLRCRKTMRYFTGDGWSDDPGQAQTFPDEIEAARACVTGKLYDIELVLRSQASGTELFSTPIR